MGVVRDEYNMSNKAWEKLKCPAYPPTVDDATRTSYAMNAHIAGDLVGRANGSFIYKDPRRAQNPTQIVVFVEKPVNKGSDLWMASNRTAGEFHRFMFSNASFLDGHIGIIMGNRGTDDLLYINRDNMDPKY